MNNLETEMTPADQRQYFWQTLQLFKSSHENGIIEITRLKPYVIHGYFTDITKALDIITSVTEVQNTWYIGLNTITEDAIKQKRTNDKDGNQPQQLNMLQTGDRTKDTDIIQRNWIFIDFDTHTGSNSPSASNAEKETAFKCMEWCFNLLTKEGNIKIIWCDSGNGYHLLIPVKLPNNSYITKVITNFLNTINRLKPAEFSAVEIDTAVTNASRTTKLYGSKTQRTEILPDRPQRYSFIGIPAEQIQYKPNQLEQLLNFIDNHYEL